MIVQRVLDLPDAVKHRLAKVLFKVRIHVAGVHHQRCNLQEGGPYIVRNSQDFVASDDHDVGFHFCP